MPNPSARKGLPESAEALGADSRARRWTSTASAVVAIPVDYRDNPLLMGQLHLSQTCKSSQ
ncbi:hypothetical protein MJ584_15895 [Klebsiella pneumoniae]|nr:hypothetical protein MJ584_15895 [Klebsiella pneumoniae]